MNPTCQLAEEFVSVETVHLPIIGNYRPFANIVLFTVDIELNASDICHL